MGRLLALTLQQVWVGGPGATRGPVFPRNTTQHSGYPGIGIELLPLLLLFGLNSVRMRGFLPFFALVSSVLA